MSEIAESASPFGLNLEVDEDEDEEDVDVDVDDTRTFGHGMEDEDEDDPTLTLANPWMATVSGADIAISPAESSSTVRPLNVTANPNASLNANARRGEANWPTSSRQVSSSSSKYSPPIEQILSGSDHGTLGSHSDLHGDARREREEFRRTNISSSTLPVPSSTDSSPKITPRALGSPSDLDGFRDLFYIPSPRDAPSVPNSPDSDADPDADADRESKSAESGSILDGLDLDFERPSPKWVFPEQNQNPSGSGSVKGLQLMIDVEPMSLPAGGQSVDEHEYANSSLPSLERYSEGELSWLVVLGWARS